MKISTVNIKDTGSVTVDMPIGARLQSAVLMNGTVQVNYSSAKDQPQEPVTLRVVSNFEEYPSNFIYLAMLVDLDTRRVTHVVYDQPTPPVQINPL